MCRSLWRRILAVAAVPTSDAVHTSAAVDPRSPLSALTTRVATLVLLHCYVLFA